MPFPLHVQLYSIGERCYRRNPIRGGAEMQSSNAADYGDTADLYEDENVEEEDEPASCNVVIERKTDAELMIEKKEQPKEKSYSRQQSVEEKEVSYDAPPGFSGPPPGLANVLPPGLEKVQPDGKQKKEHKASPLKPYEKEKPLLTKKEPERGKSQQSDKKEFVKCKEDERVMTNGEKWTARFSFSKIFHGKLIGHHRSNLTQLENATNCRIKLPNRGSKATDLEIVSIRDFESVGRCLDRLELLLVEYKKKAQVTHFVAIPCDKDEIKDRFEAFRLQIVGSKEFSDSVRNDVLFTSASRLHLTLVTIWIFDDSDLKQTGQLLDEIGKEIQSKFKEPIKARLCGVDIMNDDPSQVDVLYSKVDGKEVQEIANLVAKRLIESGRAKQEFGKDDVKLHMTLMNNRYLAQANNTWEREKFDAAKILEKFRDYEFGTVTVNEICLCPLHFNKPSTEFYPKQHVIQLSK